MHSYSWCAMLIHLAFARSRCQVTDESREENGFRSARVHKWCVASSILSSSFGLIHRNQQQVDYLHQLAVRSVLEETQNSNSTSLKPKPDAGRRAIEQTEEQRLRRTKTSKEAAVYTATATASLFYESVWLYHSIATIRTRYSITLISNQQKD